MKAFLNLLIALCFLFPFSGCIENAPLPRPMAIQPPNCGPFAGNFPNVVNGMNSAETCAVLACKIVVPEQKEVAGFANSDWLYSGPDKTFTVAELNGFRAIAKARALSVAPVGKSLLKIKYQSSLAVQSGISHWFLLATAHYGQCSRTGSGSSNTN